MTALRSLAGFLDRHLAILFLIPGGLCLALVTAYPFVFNLWASLTDLNLMYPGAMFVGLENYTKTIFDPELWHSAKNSLVWTISSVLGQLLLGLIGALALEQTRKGREPFRLILVVPWAFPAIVLAYSWRFLLDAVYGVTNHLLMLVGLIDAPVPWLTTPDYAMPIMVLINIWFGFPFMLVSILAALTMIPAQLYESARMDGAGYWQELRHITLPLIMPVLRSLVILRTIFVFNNFDFIFLTTGGGPVDATTTLPVYAFQVGWQRYDLGRMASVSVVMMLILGLLLATYVYALRKVRAPQ
ncbi:carbohydrate ABC transporter membrane protein 1, CUT1 family [Faunimonas pinastri]|uniref:Carbohydrate ABC transporter membrane protein 1, CUT1 family n=1 Tax=Faunimonas pinastri TaxID=1855383 RepID=A0A1H9EC64_9HYPH|nr:sugar ABC transporter permease [Faunimonas pinastri]SEQ22823.1 carbohydrate ABC transporter membrane protein 1, CUT1 family [Faunimonas pinastri]